MLFPIAGYPGCFIDASDGALVTCDSDPKYDPPAELVALERARHGAPDGGTTRVTVELQTSVHAFPSAPNLKRTLEKVFK